MTRRPRPTSSASTVNGQWATAGREARGSGGRLIVVPELPEVEALAGFLTERAVGRVVARVDVAAF